MGECPFKPYISCYFSDRCPGNKPNSCTYDMLLKHGTSTLDADATKNNYRIKPIEQAIVELNSADDNVYDESGNFRSFSKLRRGRRIEPFPFQSVPGDRYQLRGSEFVSQSHLARLVGKMQFPVAFPDKYRDAGIAIDALLTHQDTDDYVHNRTLEMIGVRPISRNGYCQREIFSRLGGVSLMCHIDVSLRMGDTPVLFDVKRAAQANPRHKKQLLAYALAVDQEVQEFDDFLLVNMLHVNRISSTPMNPRFDMMYVDKKKSKMIPALIAEAEETFEKQKRMMENPEEMVAALKKDQRNIYPGIVPYINYLFGNMESRYDLLDPRFRLGLAS